MTGFEPNANALKTFAARRPKLAFALLAVALLGAGACGRRSVMTLENSPRVLKPGTTGDVAFDHHILVDQFGYRPEDPKVAVIRTPHVGYDSNDTFIPGHEYQVRRASDSSPVFSAAIIAWNNGAVEASSGDSGWWFDFSSVTDGGVYYVYDVEKRVRSAPFKIDRRVYAEILKAAVRMYFYQRSGTAKQPPNAEACWVDKPAYVGAAQDVEAHDVTDRGNPAKVKNLSGGWFDAGDTNKYVTYASPAVHQLLTAYQESPAVFTDDFNIPESGNGVPDIIDEVKWEVDWLKKMQNSDGSVALKVGALDYARASPPSSDKSARFYVPSCTASTIAAAGMFAHGAKVYREIAPLVAESEELKVRAVAAWNNFMHHPLRDLHCDTGVVLAGNADWTDAEQMGAAVVAAVYLLALTGDPTYENYIEAHYRDAKPFHDYGWSRYNPAEGESLLFYASLSEASPTLKATILAEKAHDVATQRKVYGFEPDDDLYRAFMHDPQYHWGSNSPRAAYGNTNMDVVTYRIDPAATEGYLSRALGILHYFHGVNPLGMTYLTNMYEYGATVSANEIYHAWFWHDTPWSDAISSRCGPAPGYLSGGPNANAANNGVPKTLRPPTGQPPQKSYKDWNAEWPQSSWVVTEPAIYFQSGYVKLLSKFAR